MEPFNLEEALAGKPVVTLHGIPVTDIAYFPSSLDCIVYGVVNGKIMTFDIIGKHLTNFDYLKDCDLFMATILESGWINVYKDGTISDIPCGTKEAAVEYNNSDKAILDTIEIHWEK